jgi:hypothetical protein
MSGQGDYGPDGPKGPSGIAGRKGLQGDGRGPTGANLYSGGLLTISSTITDSTLTLSESSSGTYYPIELESGLNLNLTTPLPSSPPIIGTFWVFKNLKIIDSIFINLEFGEGVYVRDGSYINRTLEIAANSTVIIASLGTLNAETGDVEYVVF